MSEERNEAISLHFEVASFILDDT